MGGRHRRRTHRTSGLADRRTRPPLWFYLVVWIAITADLWRGLLKQTALENLANMKDKRHD